jgi:hypothetical protein
MKKFWIFFSACLMLQAVTAARTEADWKWTFTPTVTLSTEYDSNVFNDSDNEVDDFNYQVGLRLPFTAASQATSIDFFYHPSWFDYSSESEADNGNHVVSLRASHALSPRLSVSLSDYFSQTEDVDRILRSESSAGETGVLEDRDRRRANRVSGTLEYQLTRRSFLSLTGSNNIYRHSREDDYDSTANGGTLAYNYALSAKNTIFVSVTGRNTDYDRSDSQLPENATFRPLGPAVGGRSFGLDFDDEFDETDYYGAWLGWTHRVSATVEFTAYVGGRRTDETVQHLVLVPAGGNTIIPHNLVAGDELVYNVVGVPPPPPLVVTAADAISGTIALPNTAIGTVDDSEDDTGLVYSLDIAKSFQRGTLSFTFSQDERDRSADGGTTETQTLSTTYNHRFSPRLNAFLNASFYKNKLESDTGDEDEDVDTLRTGAGLRYAITRNLTGLLSWYHTEQKNEFDNSFRDFRTDRDLATLGLTYAWPLVR